MYTAEQIHQDFMSAEDRLLKEAQSLIDSPCTEAIKKAERLKKLGFTASKDAKLAQQLAQKSSAANSLLTSIGYFRTHYPMNKFITDEEVKKLCAKYGLVLGGVGSYIGDIPEKNIADMERFKLRKEDFVEDDDRLSFIQRQMIDIMDRRIRDVIGDPFRDRQFIPSYLPGGLVADAATKERRSSQKPAFKICAPAKDFNTNGMVVMDGHKLVVDDPIVLQPVKGGYLIVTAWGPEASDDLVKNEIQN